LEQNLDKNLEKINWEYLSGNPNAIPLLKQNTEKMLGKT
jgi:hypothetical protein